MTTENKLVEAISTLLNNRLKKYAGDKLEPSTCTMIYQEIFDSVAEVLENSGANITNESMNYISQQFYDYVIINETQILDPNIFSTRANVKNIETKELALLFTMFKNTDFAIPIVLEIKARS